jgi:hypothetical protein
MKAINNNDNMKDIKGGVNMQKTLKIKLASGDIKYLQNVVKTTKHELERFSLASYGDKNRVFALAFARKFNSILNFRGAEVNLKKDKIIFTRVVKIIVTGIKEVKQEDYPNKKELKEVIEKHKMTTSPVIIDNFNFENNNLTCTITTFNSEMDEQDLLSKFEIQHVAELNAFKKVTNITIEGIKQPEFWIEKIESLSDKMQEVEVDKKDMLKHFFNALHSTKASVYPGEPARRMSTITGSEAVIMAGIYEKAEKHYPMFKKLPFDSKIDILNESMRDGIKEAILGKKDKYVFAKATFEVFNSKDLIKKVNLNTIRKVNLLERHYRNGHLQWLNCAIEGTDLSTGIMASDLWLLLVGGRYETVLDSGRTAS